MGLGKAGIDRQGGVESTQGRIAAALTIQIEPERAQDKHVAGRQFERPPQAFERLFQASLLLQPKRRQVQDQRVFDPPGERRLGQIGRALEITVLQGRFDLVQNVRGIGVGLLGIGHHSPVS